MESQIEQLRARFKNLNVGQKKQFIVYSHHLYKEEMK